MRARFITAVACAVAATFAVVGVSSGSIRHVTVAHNSTSLQIDAAHDGISHDPVGTKWHVAWTKAFSESVSTPIIANGLVVIALQGLHAQVIAFHISTGARAWGPVTFGGFDSSVGTTYDEGVVYALGPDANLLDSDLYAINEVTGKIMWKVRFVGNKFTDSEPVSFGGSLYFFGSGLGSTIVSLSERTHRIVWQHPFEQAGSSAPAANSLGVFLNFACGQSVGLSLTGAIRWNLPMKCSGGGGTTPVISGATVLLRDPTYGNQRVNASNGQLISGFNATTIPVVANGVLYTTANENLTATSLSTRSTVFTFVPPSPYGLCGPVLDVNNTIYALTGCSDLSGRPEVLFGVSPSGTQVAEIPLSCPENTGNSRYNEDDRFASMAEGNGVFAIPCDPQLSPATSQLVVLKPT